MQQLEEYAVGIQWNAQADPTRTTTVVARYERDLVRRIRELQSAIVEYVVTNNALQINAPLGKGRSPEKVGKFLKWLQHQQAAKLLEVQEGTSLTSAASKSWQNIYIRSAYQKGIARSASQLKKGGVKVEKRWVDAAFFRPIHADALGLIYTRAYSNLKGITTAMDAKLSQTLTQAMADGKGLVETGKLLSEATELSIPRARKIARTEVIGAHAEATLNSFEEAGIEGVELLSEFTTAGDNRVCYRCKALEGKKYTVDEARGIIPVHPNCRCAWLPVVDESSRGLELR